MEVDIEKNSSVSNVVRREYCLKQHSWQAVEFIHMVEIWATLRRTKTTWGILRLQKLRGSK